MIQEQDLGQSNVDWVNREKALAEFEITRPDQKGDVEGHGFHGNRYTGGIGGEAGLAHEVYSAESAAREKLGPGTHFADTDKAGEYAAKLYEEYAHPEGAYRADATFGSPIEVRFEGEPYQSGVARVSEGGSVKPYPVITLGEHMHDQLTVIHEVAHIIANEREQGLGPWKANHGGVFKDTFKRILQNEMAAHAALVKSAERRPGQKGEGDGHAFRGNRWTGGIGGDGKVTGPPKLASLKVKTPKGLTYEKMTAGQREAVHHVVANLPKAMRWGITNAEQAGYMNPGYVHPPSHALYPDIRNSVIGAVRSLEAAGIDHEQLVRALVLDAATTSSGHAGSGVASDYSVRSYSADLQHLDASERPDYNRNAIVEPKISAERALAMADEIMRPIRLAQYVALAKESQGSHLAAGLADPSKFPEFARETLLASAQLAARDGMLFNDHVPPEGKNLDRMYTENMDALKNVGRNVLEEIDRRVAAIPPPDPILLERLNRDAALARAAMSVAQGDYSKLSVSTFSIRNDTSSWMHLPKDDPFYIAKNDEYERAHAQLRELRTEYDRMSYASAKAESALNEVGRVDRLAAGKVAIQVLSEIRPFGAKLEVGTIGKGAKSAVASFERAAAYYPTEWYSRAFGRTQRGGGLQKMNIGVSQRPTGGASEVLTYRTGSPELKDSTSVHETGHFMEDVGGRSIQQAEWKFMQDRTTKADGTRELTKSLDAQNRARGLGRWTRSSDRSYPAYADNFASVYMGKLYGDGTPNSNFELLTMGMENLRNSSSNSPTTDADYKAFVLGVLATL